ncbi:MAG: DNA-3-methyladenine glycosylase 2 family protein [Chloroflexi bacterium]|nr:DNA-3-methyladenine glycosylase 2 family protein [Chloroflexota bacterium]
MSGWPERVVELRAPLDLGATLAPLVHGRGDRTVVLTPSEAWLAVRTPRGPATLRLVHGEGRVHAVAWGTGAEHALAGAPELIGECDESSRLVAVHPVIADLQRRHPGLRLPRTGRILAALVPAVLEQKVTGTEAFRAYGALLRLHGEPAPGPNGALRLPPDPRTLAGLPYHAWHSLGVERRRADVIRGAAARADWLEAAATDTDLLDRRLRSLPGIGPWTSAEVRRVALGDPDAISIGDYHLANVVAWALAGEPRATDERMLELLAPYAGQRGRVQRLLEVGGIMAPRRGPRMALRSIAEI